MLSIWFSTRRNQSEAKPMTTSLYGANTQVRTERPRVESHSTRLRHTCVVSIALNAANLFCHSLCFRPFQLAKMLCTLIELAALHAFAFIVLSLAVTKEANGSSPETLKQLR